MSQKIANGYEMSKFRHFFGDVIDATTNISVSERDIALNSQKRARNPPLIAANFDKTVISISWFQNKNLRIILTSLRLFYNYFRQFLTHSKWNARGVIDHVADETDELIDNPVYSGLLIDESCFAKRGSMSVGVLDVLAKSTTVRSLCWVCLSRTG